MASITIKGENKSYILEFNRNSIIRMEDNGFDVSGIEKKPLSTIVKLIRGAFYMHQPKMTDDEIDEITDQLGGDEDLIKALIEMYMDAVSCLTISKKDETKNFKWEKH